MNTLLIDNYDSFTFNLFQLLAGVNDEEPVVVRNDEATWNELREWGFDNIVISPGPGRPEHPKDFGVCADAIERADVPLLGVCLGHQGLSHLCGGAVVHAPEVMHGRLSAVHHDGSGLFAGIPQGFQAVRYHSLCVARPLPECLTETAWTPDGIVMGVAHRERPAWGVQFHPESICTDHGRRLMRNFRALTERAAGQARRRTTARPQREPSWQPRRARAEGAERSAPEATLHVRRLESACEPERAFFALFAGARHSFWLDSSKVIDERSRFSFMGAAGGPLSQVVTYDVAAHELTIERDGTVERRQRTIFEHLDDELRRIGRVDADLPFDLACGFVGYFGYELKADCEGAPAHRSALPDAAFLFADRFVAFDHREQTTYVVALGDAEAERWVERIAARLGDLPVLEPLDLACVDPDEAGVTFRLSRSHETYIEDILRCHEALIEGETYEVCLTNKVHADATPDPLLLYRILRRINPAPFSAWLRIAGATVLSSSPERFLRIDRDRRVEAKPIKGTCGRGRTPEEDAQLAESLRTGEKNRAENLMICDLLRNDLGRVCEVGSVHVPHLMEVETYETVHQLVSTVAGRLREDVGAPEGIRACFPGGSMTGAPKKRTMEIIDGLEGEARGVYSGAIGYLSLNGASDLSIVIRTIVMDGSSLTIGTGGAIVMQSDPEEEYEEILLKARAPMRAVSLCAALEARRDQERDARLVTVSLQAASPAS